MKSWNLPRCAAVMRLRSRCAVPYSHRFIASYRSSSGATQYRLAPYHPRSTAPCLGVVDVNRRPPGALTLSNSSSLASTSSSFFGPRTAITSALRTNRAANGVSAAKSIASIGARCANRRAELATSLTARTAPDAADAAASLAVILLAVF